MSSSGSVPLQLFWDLSSSDGASRHAAALKLTKALWHTRKTAETSGDLPMAEASDDQAKAVALRSDGGALSVEVTYAVRRLIKGLASSRDGSREGFALGLCLLLRSFPEIDGERMMALILDSLPIKGGGLSDTEIKENNFGRLFGCMALIQTGRCSPAAKEWSAAAKGFAVDDMLCVKVLDELKRLQSCKSFMAEPTTHVVSQMMDTALSDAPVDVLAKELLPRLRRGEQEVDVGDMTPEQLEMHLFAQTLLTPGNAACLKRANIAELVEPLKKATASHPRMHQVWNRLLDLIATFKGDKTKGASEGSSKRWGPESIKVLEIFWTTVVEDALLVSSHERKYAALLLVQRLAPEVPASGLLSLLTPNMRRTIINNAGKKQCLLYSAANKTLEALMARAAQDPALAFGLLELILTRHRNFDKVTRTRTTSQLLQGLDKEGKMRYLKLVLDAYSDAAEAGARASAAARDQGEQDDVEAGVPTEDSGAVSAGPGRQRWALESLYSFVTRERASLGRTVQEALLAWLMQTAFFKRCTLPAAGKRGKARPSPAASTPCLPAPPEIQELCMTRFFSLLETLSTRGSSAGGGGETGMVEQETGEADSSAALPSDVHQALERFSPMHQAVASKVAALAAASHLPALDAGDVQLFWPVRAHLIWQALEALGVETLIGWDKSVLQVRETSWKTTTELITAAVGQDQGDKTATATMLEKRQSRALAVLMLYNGLELLSDTSNAVNVVLELQQCHHRILVLRASQGKTATKHVGQASGKKKSSKPKNVVHDGEEEGDEEGNEASEEEVMSVLVEVLVSLLARPSAVLRNVVKSTFRAFSDSMTASTIEVLVQVLVGSSGDLFDADHDDDDQQAEEDEDEEDEDEDEDEEDEDEEHEEHVAKALSGNKAQKARKIGDVEAEESEEEGDDEDEDGSDKDEDDWDDDKMFEIDHLVAAAFKSRLEEAKLAKQTSSLSLVLKLRTLELVEVFLSRKEPSPLALVLLEPLLQLAIEGAGGDKKMGESAQQRISFHAKVSSLYADKLCRLRPAPAVTSAAQGKEVVGMVERLCQRMPTHGELSAAGLSFLLRVLTASVGKHASALENAVVLVGNLLQRWAGKKHSNINPLFFTQLFERQPAVAWALAPAAARHAQTAPTDFHRTTCFEMLLALARQTGVLKQDEAAVQQAGRVMAALPEALQTAVEHAAAEGTSKKTTKMVQAGLALALKCVDLDQEYGLGLDLGKLSALAAHVEASSIAGRAKSVQQAALRLKQRTCSKGGKGAAGRPQAAGRQEAADGAGGAKPSKAVKKASGGNPLAKPSAKKRKTSPG